MAKDRTTIGQMREQVSIVTVSSDSFDSFSVRNNYAIKYTLRSRVRDMEHTESKRGISLSTEERTHVAIIRNGTLGDSSTLYDNIDNDNLVMWRGAYYSILGKERIARNVDDPKLRFIRIVMVYSHEVDAMNNPSPMGSEAQPNLLTVPDSYMLSSIPDQDYIPLNTV